MKEDFRDTAPVSQVALLQSYDSRWAIEFQKHTDKYDQLGSVEKLLPRYASTGAIHGRNQSVLETRPIPLGGRARFECAAARIWRSICCEYVANGGNLVLGPRSGMKDQFNALLPQRQPGYLVDTLGGRVEQYYALEKDVPIVRRVGAAEKRPSGPSK